MTLILGGLLYLVIGCLIARASVRAMARARLTDWHAPKDLRIWLLFPISADECRAASPVSQFDFGMMLANYDQDRYQIAIVFFWPVKIIANIQLLLIVMGLRGVIKLFDPDACST
jgi:hypothetical protein